MPWVWIRIYRHPRSGQYISYFLIMSGIVSVDDYALRFDACFAILEPDDFSSL
jgi:hypothetical protein